MTFWTRRRWRGTIVVTFLAFAAYGCQIWAEETTHPDSQTWHLIAVMVRSVFIAAALVGFVIVLRPDQ